MRKKPLASKKRLSANQFCAVGRMRYGDGKVLRDRQRHNGSVYLSGYAVECLLKAIIAKRKPAPEIHDLDRLLEESREASKAIRQKQIHNSFARMAQWTVHLRYSTQYLTRVDVDDFFVRLEEVWRCLEPLAK